MMRTDNTGAIFMGKNVAMSLWTKNMEICTKFGYEYMERGIVKITFVRSKDNTSDIMTKNSQGNLYDNYSSQLVMVRP